MEYEEAPSGFVTMYNYKEPFMAFEAPSWNSDKGHGFTGVLLHDRNTDTIQCHLCGKWFESLQAHTKKEHGVKPNDYKQLTGLAKRTVLLNEAQRKVLIENGIKYSGNLRPGGKHTEEQKEKIRASLIKRGGTMEKKNEEGTCPAQLISRLKKLYEQLGRTPTDSEVTFHQTLRKVYGTMEEACRIAEIPYRPSGKTIHTREKYTKVFCIKFLKDHYEKNHKFPSAIWFKENNESGLYRATNRHGVKFLYKEALRDAGVFRTTDLRVHYSPEELIEFLRRFKEINNRNPSISDCRRKLLPSAGRYYHYFKSWGEALKTAFPQR